MNAQDFENNYDLKIKFAALSGEQYISDASEEYNELFNEAPDKWNIEEDVIVTTPTEGDRRSWICSHKDSGTRFSCVEHETGLEILIALGINLSTAAVIVFTKWSWDRWNNLRAQQIVADAIPKIISSLVMERVNSRLPDGRIKTSEKVIIQAPVDMEQVGIDVEQFISRAVYEKAELSRLIIYATGVIIWLSLCLLGTLFTTVVIYIDTTFFSNLKYVPLMLCISAGTFGSSIMALLSSAERIAHGWELSKGQKLPRDVPKDKFVAKMIPQFMVRPFLGSAMGFVVYAGIVSGYLTAVKSADVGQFSQLGLIFLATLSGLFDKTLLAKLKIMFKAVIGG